MKVDKEICSVLFKKWKENLSQEERDVLFEYSDFLYRDINRFLLENEGNCFSKEYLKKIEVLDNCLTFNFPMDTELYRAEYREEDIETLELAYEVIDEIVEFYPNFISTSFSEKVALRHMGILRNSEFLAKSFLIFNLSLSSEVKCGYIDEELSKYGELEAEIIIARKVNFKIQDYKRRDGFDDVLNISALVTTYE